MTGREFFPRTNKRTFWFLPAGSWEITEGPTGGRPGWQKRTEKSEAEFPLADWARVYIAAVLESGSLTKKIMTQQTAIEAKTDLNSEAPFQKKREMQGEKAIITISKALSGHPLCLVSLLASLF